MENSADLLIEKYADLPGSKPVEKTVQKRLREGKPGPATKESRVGAYLDRIEKVLSSGTRVNDERGWELLKNKIVKEFTIDTNDQDTLAKIAHGLYESEKKLAIEQGRGADVERLERQSEVNIVDRYKELILEKRDIQERTLSSWLSYLRENDAAYPIWFRYFVVRNLQKMGTLDKGRVEYTKRTDHTIAPFPELNSEALGFAYRMLTVGIGKDEFAQDSDKQNKLTELIAKKDFAKLYSFAQIETAGRLNRDSIEGRWVKYEQGSDYHILENALRGKGTGWCTAEGSAYAHLQGGDFYVYYTKGDSGAFAEPRVAIRMENGQVSEVRGVNPRQELEPVLVDIATEQYHGLPGGEKFDKMASDMKRMTDLVKKQEAGEVFTKDDLVFLYEVDGKIEGFGYEDDPRIKEIRSQRNIEEDMLIVFNCTKEQIAGKASEINQHTKAYVGKLTSGIFDTLRKHRIEHIYTSFPEGKIRIQSLEIGGKTSSQLQAELKGKGFRVSEYARDMLESQDFKTLKSPQGIDLVRLTVKDLGFDRVATTDQIYERAQKLGLELCPAEVGLRLRLSYIDQPLGEWIVIGMEQIPHRLGGPSVFWLERHGDGLWLDGRFAGTVTKGWLHEAVFVFSLRKLKS